MANIINGTEFLVYVDDVAIAASKSCKLMLTHEVRDASYKHDGWNEIAEGKRRWSIAADGLLLINPTNFNILSNLYISNRITAILKFKDEDSNYWQARGYLMSFETEATYEQSTTYTVTFQGTNKLSVYSPGQVD